MSLSISASPKDVSTLSLDDLPLICASIKGHWWMTPAKLDAFVKQMDNTIQAGYTTQSNLNDLKRQAGYFIPVPFKPINEAYPDVDNPAVEKWEQDRDRAHDELVEFEAVWRKSKTKPDEGVLAHYQELRTKRDFLRRNSPPGKISNPNLPSDMLKHKFEPAHIGAVSTKLKQTLALSDHPVKKQALAALYELQKIEAVLTFLASKVGKPPTKAERKQQALAMAPPATREARALVSRTLTLMTDQVKEKYITDTETPWLEELARFFALSHHAQLKFLKMDGRSEADRLKRNEASKAEHLKTTGRDWGFAGESRGRHWIESILDIASVGTEDKSFGNGQRSATSWKPYKDWRKRIHAAAVAQAERMQKAFVEKNTDKLASIIEAKGNIDRLPEILNVSCHSAVIQSNIKFVFTDRSHFTVRNKIVEKGSYDYRRGSWKPFYQFPTTFHNVTLGNGKPLPGQVSEDDMNKVFAKAKRKAA
jgi:hypothetical protein